jgi:hypothetical protein
MLLQSSKAITRFAAPEHQALARLLCLSSASDYEGGDSVCAAFDELDIFERAALTRWLTADGINSKPGYVLAEAPSLLQNSQANKAVGLAAALKMMVRVQELCAAASSRFNVPMKVYVNLEELASWAKDASGSAEVFTSADMQVSFEDRGDTRYFTLNVMRPDGDYSNAGMSMGKAESCCSKCCRYSFGFLMFLLFFVSGAGAVVMYLRPELCIHYVKSLKPVKHMYVEAALGGTSLLSLIFFMLCCRLCSCCSGTSDSYSWCNRPPNSREDQASQPFLCSYSRLRVEDEHVESPNNV